jgi:hypothetical protein
MGARISELLYDFPTHARDGEQHDFRHAGSRRLPNVDPELPLKASITGKNVETTKKTWHVSNIKLCRGYFAAAIT